MDILIGADPELAVWDKENNCFVSGWGMIEGTKEEPLKVDGGAVQVDGFALEFNVDPVDTREKFIDNTVKVMRQLHEMIDPRYALVATPYANFSEEYMSKQPKKSLELGCSPDFDAYTGKTNPTPNASSLFRTYSGHVHVGWTSAMDPMDEGHFTGCCMLAKRLDYSFSREFFSRFRGVPDISDLERGRRKLYGKPGAFRPKPYGVEYRTLSNTWLTTKRSIGMVFDTVATAWNSCMRTPESSINRHFNTYRERTLLYSHPSSSNGYSLDINIHPNILPYQHYAADGSICPVHVDMNSIIDKEGEIKNKTPESGKYKKYVMDSIIIPSLTPTSGVGHSTYSNRPSQILEF